MLLPLHMNMLLGVPPPAVDPCDWFSLSAGSDWSAGGAAEWSSPSAGIPWHLPKEC